MNSTNNSDSKQQRNPSPQLGDLVEFKLGNQTYTERVLSIETQQHSDQKEIRIKVERPSGHLILKDHEILKIHPRKSAAQEISRLREMANNLQDLYDDISCASKHDILACCDEIIKQVNSIKDRVF